jgi:hypothetical protein
VTELDVSKLVSQRRLELGGLQASERASGDGEPEQVGRKRAYREIDSPELNDAHPYRAPIMSLAHCRSRDEGA